MDIVVRLHIFSVDNGYQQLTPIPAVSLNEDQDVNWLVSNISQEIVDLSPVWINYRLLDVVNEDGVLYIEFGGIIPYQTPINTQYKWGKVQSEYLTKAVNEYV